MYTFVLLLLSSSGAQTDWRFLGAYPPHYVSKELAQEEHIVLDGHLNESAWLDVPYSTSKFVDITHHSDSKLNDVPAQFQVQLKIRWDKHFLYIGAELHEPFVYGTITGHNIQAPYHDNDFEVFLDPSGTTQYYKEYEMNALNATYDINWGVPDGAGLECDNNGTKPYLPVCVNTSFGGYAGTWTMVAREAGLEGGGMTVATSYDRSAFGTYTFPYAKWTAEIAFPIRSDPSHGGLLDAGTLDFSAFDPNMGDAGVGRPRYWAVDFARAEHPRAFTADNTTNWCPFGCGANLTSATPSLTNPTSKECAAVKARWPTLLGVDPWSCYWEWVWSDVGADAYMHRPTQWGFIQFSSSGDEKCGNIEWPGRHLAMQVHTAQATYFKAKNMYSPRIATLLPFCVSPHCAVEDLKKALAMEEVFAFSLHVIPNATTLSAECTSRPCYRASVSVTYPDPTAYTYTATINENQRLLVEHPDSRAPCLF